MKNNRIKSFLFLPLVATVLLGLVACSDWTEMEIVDGKTTHPWEQDAQLWSEYMQKLRTYKQSDHYIVYARLKNSPEAATSEQDFMRCLPDSLDIVSLTNADNFSKFDAADMTVMRDKGTKVLYQVDYAGRAEEFADAAALSAYLDKVIASVAANAMDGYSFTGIPRIGDAATEAAAALIVQKLSSDEGKLLVFEGNPLFIAEADRAKIDYYALNTEKTEDVSDVRQLVLNALGYAKIPASKLLLSAEAGGALRDEDRTEYSSIDEMSRRVISYGPLAGLAVYDIGKDYYNSDLNYKMIRMAIQTLNPSK